MIRHTLGIAAIVCFSQVAVAQQFQQDTGTFGTQTNGFNTGSLTQTGQITADVGEAASFVGASSATTTNIRSQTTGFGGVGNFGGIGGIGGLGGIGGFGGLGGIGGFGRNSFNSGLGFGAGQQAGFNAGTNTPTQGTIRTSLRIGFTPAQAATPTVISERFARRLTEMRQIRAVGAPIAVSMSGRTVVLTGAVESEHQRELAERVARLEPGVSEVQNDLTVIPRSSSPFDLPTLDSESLLPSPE